MKRLKTLQGCQKVLRLSVLLVSSTIFITTATPILAQDSSDGGEPVQTQLSQTDLETLDDLVDIAQHNSPDVRIARDAMGITPFMDAVTIAVTPKHYTTFTTDRSDPTIPSNYRYQESGMDLSATINPLYIIRGIQQQASLRAQLRHAQQQVRYAVMESYVAYLQASQSAEIAQRQFDTFVASLPQTQIASTQLQPGQLSDPNWLADNEEYVAAATELFDANLDTVMCLENLAVTVGLSSQETMAVIQEHQTADREDAALTTSASMDQPTDARSDNSLSSHSSSSDSSTIDSSVQTTAESLLLPAMD